MGKEARCVCHWGGRSGNVRALLESGELLVTGAFRERVPLSALEDVRATGGNLECAVAGDRVVLELGPIPASRWAQAIVSGPPALARKLGITEETLVHVWGTIDDDALDAALAVARDATAPRESAQLAIVRSDEPEELTRWLEQDGGAPASVWIVYAKGKNAPLGESTVRALMRARGYVDTKVARVSERLTALRFSAARPAAKGERRRA